MGEDRIESDRMRKDRIELDRMGEDRIRQNQESGCEYLKKTKTNLHISGIKKNKKIQRPVRFRAENKTDCV